MDEVRGPLRHAEANLPVPENNSRAMGYSGEAMRSSHKRVAFQSGLLLARPQSVVLAVYEPASRASVPPIRSGEVTRP